VNIIHNSNDEQAKTKTTRTDKVLPAGTYEAEIVKATARQSEYSKSNDNPDGWELSLWIDVQHQGERFRVFESIPTTHVNRLNEVLAACDLPKLTPKIHRIEESNLEGHVVTIRTFVTKSNKARVGDFTKRTSKPSPAKAAVKVDDSDIPF